MGPQTKRDRPSPPAGEDALVLAADALLPQTQCGQCGYSGCLPYARALAAKSAPINRCPPGGDATIHDLAALFGSDAPALDPACGAHRPLHVARIDESRCIGCTLCIQACPVDAILGAARRMHSVLSQECTGCDLCLAPCPVDCIAMVPVQPARAWTRVDADRARGRLRARQARQALEQSESEARLVRRGREDLLAPSAGQWLGGGAPGAGSLVARALERVRARRRPQDEPDPGAAAVGRKA
jgi:Na+-translocating ferredoxin:NAD+ oxidoreductase subunit B